MTTGGSRRDATITAGSEVTAADVKAVRAFIRPYASWHDHYQAYYREGLRVHSRRVGVDFRVTSMSRLPKPLGLIRHIQDEGFLLKFGRAGHVLERRLDALGRALEGKVRQPAPFFDAGTGQYFVTVGDGTTRKICIDAVDYPELSSSELADWNDLYFKTNWWPSVQYPSNVRPLVNGDPLVLDHIAGLRARRSTSKKYDLCCIMRVWGGRDTVEGIEHNLRMLEAVNRARGIKVMLAVIVVGDRREQARRLHRSGIPSTTRHVPADEIWRLTAQSRLNIIRLGVHDCLPWRMTGSLALGSCVVLDQSPRTQWPEPLRQGTNYLSLGLDTVRGGVASAEAYEAVPDLLAAWLATPGLIEDIARANAAYFDDHGSAERVGAHILSEAVRLRTS